MPILNAYERSLLLPALWQLARAKWDVLRRPAAEWMPRGGEQGAGSKEQQARSTQHAAGREAEKCLAVVRVIEGLGRRVPWRSVCMDQALAAHRILKKRGLRHTLHLGVRKLPNGRLEAHAWISDGDHVILGRSDQPFHQIANFDL